MSQIGPTTLIKEFFSKNVIILLFIDRNSALSRSRRAQQYKILVEPLTTLKNHCELMRRLTDKPDIVLKSSDNSEQNLGG